MNLTDEEREARRKRCADKNRTHGLSKTPEYSCWKGMKKRCYNPADKRYVDYGARGITVCDQWLNNFPAFLEHIGNMPTDGQTWSVGRIDNNKGYCPGNVRWETLPEQARNRRRQRNNTSGINGIQLRSRTIAGRVYKTCTAIVRFPDGVKSKDFSRDKFGEENAIAMAVAWRQEQLAKLVELGIVYAEGHGQDG